MTYPHTHTHTHIRTHPHTQTHRRIVTFGAQRETGKNKESSSNALDFSNNRGAPFFDKAASKNVTALLGKTAYLNCRVKNLGNKTFLNYPTGANVLYGQFRENFEYSAISQKNRIKYETVSGRAECKG
ncbi:hypothetical protein RUM43_000340 [Polyplax serrata]|uniref:Uncharacterized protein n=1 Tax=Polyplax serrata TaxID=468196 RepID=A0AAN8SGV8_POLSC